MSASSSADPQRLAPSWFDRALLITTVLSCAVALSPNLVDPDLWGHVTYGRDVLRDGLPSTSTYTYAAPGYRWINHENLAEIVLAVAADTVGPVGMMMMKCLLGMSVIGMIMWTGRRMGAGFLAICGVPLIVAVNVGNFWAMRPQLASFFLFGVTLTLLEWCFADWRGHSWRRNLDREPTVRYSADRLRWLWLSVPIFFLWANAHGGFVAGYCIFAAYLAIRGIEVAWVRGSASRGLLKRLTLMIVVAGLATLVNPYGPYLHLWLIESLGAPRPEIMEWRPPDLTTPIMLPFWLLMVSGFASLLFTRRGRDVTHMILLALTLWQALMHVRHIPFLAIGFGFWITPHLDSLLQRCGISLGESDTQEPAMTPLIRRLFFGGIASALVLVCLTLTQRLKGIEVPRSHYPVSAFQYIADEELEGRVVVTFNWAQYLIAAFGAEESGDDGVQVSFDGRFRTCYPQEIVDLNFDFVLGEEERRFRSPGSAAFDDDGVLAFGRPDLVLINRLQPHSVNVMFRVRDNWVLLYQDKLAQLWGRRDKYDDPRNSAFIPPSRRSISETEQEGTVAWPALPTVPVRSTSIATR